MKNKGLVILLLLLVAGMPVVAMSQTITASIKTTALCPGEPLTVDYTVTGTYDPLNTFTVQISDADGSFKSFLNIGSAIHKTESGSIVVTTPLDLPAGTKYRIRVIGSSPLTSGTDNGADLSVGSVPKASFRFSSAVVLEGDPVKITNESTGGSTFDWNFGEGATPQTFQGATPPSVSYSTPGAKVISVKVTSATGCEKTLIKKPDIYDQDITNADTTYAHPKNTLSVYSCTPAIPHVSLAMKSPSDDPGGYTSGWIWLQPGVSYHCSGGLAQTIFAETGSTVIADYFAMTVYLKSGASFVGRGAIAGAITIIRDPGASLTKITGEKILECSSLSFDYSNAPAITSGVNIPLKMVATPVYPNPASSILNITCNENLKEVWLTNELGQASLIETGKFLPTLTLNIGEFTNGAYNLLLKYTDHTEVQRVIIAH